MSTMSFDTSLKLNKFDVSNKHDFLRYKEKLLVIGQMGGGFDKALESNLPTVDASGNNLANNIKKRNTTWSYLIFSLEGLPLVMIRQVVDKNPFTAWTRMINRYGPLD